MNELKVIKIRQLGKDQYSVVEGNLEKGSVFYRKMGTDDMGYEVGFNSEGQPFCNCKGFRYRDSCKHSADFEELAPTLVDEMDAGRQVMQQEPVEDGRIPREDLEVVGETIVERFHMAGLVIEPAGSWRRGRSSVHDLDFVTTATPEEIEAVCGSGLDTTASGPKVIRFETAYAEDKEIQIDFTLTDQEHWGAALMYLTGSKEMNIFMRKRAKSREMKLTRNGLVVRTTDEMLASKTEREIFKKLDLEFVPPSARDNNAWEEYQRN